MMKGIYCIKNTFNNKRYVGSSKNLDTKFTIYLGNLRRNKHHNKYLQRSFNKYGEHKFVYYIQEECDQNVMVIRERYWINIYHTRNPKYGYNFRDPVTLKGYKHTIEAKLKMSKSHTGKKLTEEHREKISNGNTGKKMSKEFCIKLGKRRSKPVIQCSLDNKFIKRWESCTEASKILGVCLGSIHKCVHKKRVKAGGYKWE